MFRRLKHLLVPHSDNDHKPHILRETAVSLLFVAVIGLFFFPGISQRLAPAIEFIATIYPSVLIDLANDSRQESGLHSLVKNNKLAEAAQMKAEHMAENDYFDHISPDGVAPWHWIREAGYEFAYAGENLAIDFSESKAVDKAWMNSPAHRDNILVDNYTEIGIAAHTAELNGRETTIVVQMFGSPAGSTSQLPEIASAEVDQPAQEDGVSQEPETDNGSDQSQSSESESEEVGQSAGQQQSQGGPEEFSDSGNSQGESLESSLGAEDGAGQKNEALNEVEVLLSASSDQPRVMYHDYSFMSFSNREGHLSTSTPVSTAEVTPDRSYMTPVFKSLFLNPTQAVQNIYLILSIIIIVVTASTIVVEAEKQHPVNVVYGCLLLALIVGLMYLNEATLTTQTIGLG